jgi:type I restriction enzyme S subunit
MSELKKIPSGWVETTLGKVGKVITGKTPSKDHPEEWGDLVDFITPTEIKSEYKYIFNCPRKLSSIGTERFKKMILPKKSVIVTCIGSDMGKVVLNKNEALANQQINSIVVNEKNCPDFVYYLLKNSYKILRKKAEGSGSTMPILNKSTFENLDFYMPQDLSEQKSISQILSSFDDKIELLQAQNKTLEAIAQTVFQEWFGKYNIEDELPKGWKIFQLSELVDIINGYSYKGSELVESSEEALVTLKSFDRNGGFQTRGFKPFIGKPKSSQEVKIGDLIVAHTDLTQDADLLGNPAFIFDDGGFKKMYITMDLVKIVPIKKDVSSSFLYYLMKDKAFKGHCVGYSNGTTVLHLSKRAIPEYQLLLPVDFDLVKRFSEIAESTTTKISLNKIAIKSLTISRQELLPRLMSGEIRVNKFTA